MKKLALSITMLIALIIIPMQMATQFVAFSFDYQALLGSNYRHIYAPWKIFIWWQWFDDYPNIFNLSAAIAIIAASIILLAISVFKSARKNTAQANNTLHGSAKWAVKQNIIDAALLNDEGVYVGAWLDNGKTRYLRHNGPEHILTYAPTRSGKGVGLVIPTLLSWPHSTVVTDIKGELWDLTAGWRQQHAKNKVLKFEPAALDGSISWNPLLEIRLETQFEVGDAQNLASLIVDPDGRGLNSHWQKTAQALLTGLILHVLYKSRCEALPATLTEIDRLLANPEQDTSDLWQEMIEYKHLIDKAHPVVASSAQDMLDRPKDEAGSVLSTAKSYLALYRDPVVAKNTTTSDFKIKDLMHHANPVSLYITTTPNDNLRMRALIRILINMIIRLLSEDINRKYTHRLLFLIDEFPSLGKLEILEESLAFMAGYGVKFYLICQDTNQLKSREKGYGINETISANCHIQNAYSPNIIETAEHLSKLTGQATLVKEQITSSGKKFGLSLNNISKSIHEYQRPLLTPDECMRLPPPKKKDDLILESGDMLIFAAGTPAIYGKQILYFKDKIFSARAKIAPPKTDKISEQLLDCEKICLQES